MLALRSKQDKLAKTEPASALTFESATAEVIERHHPVVERSTIYVMSVFLIALFVFICFKKLDRVVTASGRLVPVNGAVTVQPLDKAIINQILVSPGQVVKKGQILATCDPTFAEADVVGLKQKVDSLVAEKSRIEAEEERRSIDTGNGKPYDRLQASISSERLVEFRSGVADFDEKISSTEAQAEGLRKSIEGYKSEVKIASEQEAMYSKLEEEKVTSHLQTITVANQRVEESRLLETAEADLEATEHTLESLRAERKAFVDKWHDDDLTNLVQVDNLLDQARDDYAKAVKTREMINLTSPVDAVVLTIPALTQGAIATDAEPLFSLVPLDAPMEVDAEIDAQDRGFVRVGDTARIKFDAFHFMEHGVAEGSVKTISEDAFTEETSQDEVTNSSQAGNQTSTRTPYFDARIKITAVKLHDVPTDLHLTAGMTLQADIVVGERTIFWYLLGGALRSGSESMREP